MSYQVPQYIDPNKIFLVNRSEIEGRLDPLFYIYDLTKFIKNQYSDKLSNLCTSFKSGFGAGKKDQTQADEGVIQIRPTNIDSEGFLKFDKNIYVPINNQIDFITPKTVLFNNTNSQELVGKTALLTDNIQTYTSNHITAIKVNEEKLLPEYLWLILNIYHKNKVFYSICTNWNNQSGVGIDLLKSIKIPLPLIKKQKKITDFYKSAYAQKQQKEAEAQKLLDSIDDYLLGELGIVLPDQTNMTPENISEWMSAENPLVKNGRLFLTKFSEVEGNRFDPKSYDIKTQNLKSAIFNSQEELKPLASLIVQSVAGDWGIDEDVEERDDYQRCLVIRATEFNNQFNLNLDGNRVKYRLIKKEKLQKIDIQPNDLLIEKSGGSPDQPVGRIAILSEDLFDGNNLCYSNFIHKIRINKSIANPLFVYYFLKTIYNIKLTETMQSQTNGIRNLIMSNYFAQQIPIPNITKQLVIVKNITHIRKKAKQLQYEAKSILDNTKQQVERIIMES